MTYGGSNATGVNVISSSLLTATLPAHASYGSVAVAVTANSQTSTKANAFAYDLPFGMNMTLRSQIGGSVQAVAVQGNTLLLAKDRVWWRLTLRMSHRRSYEGECRCPVS